MKMARMISAITMPIIRAYCCSSLGTANFAMMMMKMKRLSMDREYSTNQPEKNSRPCWWSQTTHTPMPKRMASPT